MKKDLHCPICGADFETKTDLDEHERRRHTQQGVSGISPSNEYPVEPKDQAPRENKVFTRGDKE